MSENLAGWPITCLQNCLTWKYHVDYITFKISMIVGIAVSRGHGFKPRWSPEFFSGFFTQLHLIAFITARINLHLIVGIIARLRHSVPLNTLIQIYRSLIFPYTYTTESVLPGTKLHRSIWGRSLSYWQKRALRLMFFAGNRSHAIPLVISANVLPLDMFYFETVCSLN